MSRMGVSTETLENKQVDAGIYEVTFTGFKPTLSNNKQSVNYNPQLKIVNHPEANGRPLFDNLNSGAGWIVEAFVHAFGLKMDVDVSTKQAYIPGDFVGADTSPEDPSKWQYTGPLLGRTARVEVAPNSYTDKTGTQKTNMKIKQYFCAVTDCNLPSEGRKHPDNLLK